MRLKVGVSAMVSIVAVKDDDLNYTAVPYSWQRQKLFAKKGLFSLFQANFRCQINP